MIDAFVFADYFRSAAYAAADISMRYDAADTPMPALFFDAHDVTIALSFALLRCHILRRCRYDYELRAERCRCRHYFAAADTPRCLLFSPRRLTPLYYIVDVRFYLMLLLFMLRHFATLPAAADARCRRYAITPDYADADAACRHAG